MESQHKIENIPEEIHYCERLREYLYENLNPFNYDISLKTCHMLDDKIKLLKSQQKS
jgi:hypothetical protein